MVVDSIRWFKTMEWWWCCCLWFVVGKLFCFDSLNMNFNQLLKTLCCSFLISLVHSWFFDLMFDSVWIGLVWFGLSVLNFYFGLVWFFFLLIFGAKNTLFRTLVFEIKQDGRSMQTRQALKSEWSFYWKLSSGLHEISIQTVFISRRDKLCSCERRKKALQSHRNGENKEQEQGKCQQQ